MSAKPAVACLSEHRGWAELVCVGARGREPVVLQRRRVELIEKGVPTQPHHHEGAELELTQVRELLAVVEKSIAKHAHAALVALRDDLDPGHRLVAIALARAPGPSVPASLDEILRSQSTMIAADGLLYHSALCKAAGKLGVEVVLHERRAESAAAALSLRTDEARVEAFLAAAGREIGPPWRKEHRSAAAAALAGLGAHAKLALPD